MTAETLPALFISHGAPLFAIEPGTSGPALAKFGASLPADLRGVVIMSPHWMAQTPAVMTNPQPATWHDFGGFPKALYELQYPAPGSAELGEEVLGLLHDAGIDAQGDARRPLDHGAWVPLMHLLPKANVPVVQVALPTSYGPAEVFAMGKALRSLRGEGVLVVGSGSMTHNLAEFFGGAREAAPYVVEFSRWIEAAVVQGKLEELLDYRRKAPHAARAHPSEDHFLPLFFALGAGGFGEDGVGAPDYLTREVMYGILAMDSFAIQ
jgi:4,5-DOPA dioxygenase extradiol